jgi:hypothetical protein
MQYPELLIEVGHVHVEQDFPPNINNNQYREFANDESLKNHYSKFGNLRTKKNNIHIVNFF